MNIGQAATASGLPAKTIRYYEDIGLIAPQRDSNGYRSFSEAEIHRLAFLNRARGLGFSIEDCRALVSLYDDASRASEDVKRLAAEHLDRIDARIAELQEMRATVAGLVESCAGDGRPDCPILDDLAAGPLCRHAPRRRN
ncbi:Cu(I)-responsive transcriptional regulator [Rhodobacter sp. NTK016B]|uniref:Cu(I)-responsive transcriptional regulator n=1 Tax=Rhodobacter sp. NTK016B TaxID=2759676 RepID=UPI001A904AE4|nr:Cu(I)-responsive transcriptional regulator [Rhodobacter sp. NTK016B]MBN8290697.1 Cu(I)-responsive transcriptional regulator [Rhodobacter sp. NTK016B]